MERRYLDHDAAGLVFMETREGQPVVGVRGYAAVYSTLSENLGGFREEIAPGTFARVLGKNPDVRLTLNHDHNVVLARTKSGTLRLAADERGLLMDAPELPNTQAGRDVAEMIRRGDVSQMSFAFRNAVDKWEERAIDGQRVPVRTLTDFDLVDVAVVTYPAYEATSVALRCARESLEKWVREEKQRRNSIHCTLLRLLETMS